MTLKKGKINSKILLILLQLVVMSFLFVALADKQTILLIKDFVDSLGVNSNIQSILARLYAGCKLLVNMPSLVALGICVLQVLCAAKVFKKILTSAPERTNIEAEKVRIYISSTIPNYTISLYEIECRGF